MMLYDVKLFIKYLQVSDQALTCIARGNIDDRTIKSLEEMVAKINRKCRTEALRLDRTFSNTSLMTQEARRNLQIKIFVPDETLLTANSMKYLFEQMSVLASLLYTAEEIKIWYRIRMKLADGKGGYGYYRLEPDEKNRLKVEFYRIYPMPDDEYAQMLADVRAGKGWSSHGSLSFYNEADMNRFAPWLALNALDIIGDLLEDKMRIFPQPHSYDFSKFIRALHSVDEMREFDIGDEDFNDLGLHLPGSVDTLEKRRESIWVEYMGLWLGEYIHDQNADWEWRDIMIEKTEGERHRLVLRDLKTGKKLNPIAMVQRFVQDGDDSTIRQMNAEPALGDAGNVSAAQKIEKENETPQHQDPEKLEQLPEDDMLVYMNSVKKGYNAVGRFDGRGITVLQGSRICEDWNYYSKPLLEQRRLYVDEHHVLKQNLYFGTPSQASVFVRGRSSNGWTMWKFKNGTELTSFREKSKNLSSRTEMDSSIILAHEPDVHEESIRESVEQILSQIKLRSRELSYKSGKTHISIYLQGICIAIVYFRKNEIRIEIRKDGKLLQIYNSLLEQNLVYQKPSADPNSTPGKFSFFAARDSVEQVLSTLIRHQSEQKFPGTTNAEITAINQVRIEDKPQGDLRLIENKSKAAETIKTERSTVQADSVEFAPRAENQKNRSAWQFEEPKKKQPEDDKLAALSRQLAQLQEIVLRQTNMHQAASVESVQHNIQDNRYRIAVSRNDVPELSVNDSEKIIHNLTFSILFFAEGCEKQQGKFQAFFMDADFAVASNVAEFHAETGQTINCRFTLKSKMSEKGTCFLGIRDSRDMHDELLKLIPFRIEILFKADFDL